MIDQERSCSDPRSNEVLQLTPAMTKINETVIQSEPQSTAGEPECKPDANQPAKEMKTKAAKIIDEYTDVFQGLGCPDGDYHIKVDTSVPPVVYPACKIPFSIKDKFKDELCRMEKFTKVTGPSEWVNSIVVTEKKNENLRICLDPRALNKAVQREHYPMKTVEEIAAELEGTTVLTILMEQVLLWMISLSGERMSHNMTIA